MEVSFIIVTYKRNEMLQLCVESIYKQQNLPQYCEIIVVDNGGSAAVIVPDDTIPLRLEHAPDNLGAAGGRNLGMKLAQGKYWILMDDDATLYDPMVARRIIDLFEQHPNCGGVGGCGYSAEGELQISHLPFPDKDFAVALQGVTEAPYYYGFIHALRADVIRHVGDYPERFVIMMEEVDLSYRIIDAGYIILYDPQIAVTHYHSEQGRATIGDKYWYRNTLNKMQLGWRLLPLPYPVTIALIWSGATLWYTKNPLLLWRIWRDFVGMIPELRRERNPIGARTIAYLRRVGGRLWY